MAEVDPMIVDNVDRSKPMTDGPGQKKAPKRKRVDPSLPTTSPEEKNAKITQFRSEIDSLVKFCKDLVRENRGTLMEHAEKVGISSASLNGVIACLMEESDLSLSKLVDEIFEKVKGRIGNGDVVTKASVKNSVLIIGQRLCYGVTNADADILEDEAHCALWCWETRDLKLMPKLLRASLKVRRTCRKKIQDRIMAVLTMINTLEKSENEPNVLQDLIKASKKLNKVSNEANIRELLDNMPEKSGSEIAEKEAKREEKPSIKEMEKSKRLMEREKKKLDRELQKKKLQSEKELKRLHDEAEKEKRRREKEENEKQKQIKREQEEAEKDQRRKEKEEAEFRKQLAIQKQASLMESFLKRNKASSSSQNGSSMKEANTAKLSCNIPERMAESVTQAMDSVLAQKGGIEVEDIWSSHLNAWRCIGHSIHSKRTTHWGIRQKPKTELVKEIKLSTNKELSFDGDLTMEENAVGWIDSNVDRTLSQINTDDGPLSSGKKGIRVKKLLQFDKSHRPAFYGIWPKKSRVVVARNPFVKDPDVDYEIDSDEEWEEDEPGESLSDCDKDEEDENMEGCSKDDDEDESEDGFFVPDGYLSEDEGVKADEMESDDLVEKSRNLSTSEQQVPSEEFCNLYRQQKYLNNLTERALKKSEPLIILNLMHEKTSQSSAEELTGLEKLERMCLQTLSIHPLPGFADIEISVHNDVVDDERETSSNKSSTTLPATAVPLLDSDLPQIISVIQSSPHSIGKIEKSLQNKFPAVRKSHLRNKVREISEFSENRWQVKKEILSKHGLSKSPETSIGKMMSMTRYLKRCHPPSQPTANSNETFPESTKKSAAIVKS